MPATESSPTPASSPSSASKKPRPFFSLPFLSVLVVFSAAVPVAMLAWFPRTWLDSITAWVAEPPSEPSAQNSVRPNSSGSPRSDPRPGAARQPRNDLESVPSVGAREKVDRGSAENGRGEEVTAGDPAANSPAHASGAANSATLVSGLLANGRGRPRPGETLAMRTARGERNVWTDERGHFAFVAAESDFPLTIFSGQEPSSQESSSQEPSSQESTSDTALLAHWVQKPRESRIYVNLQEVVSRRSRQLFRPTAVEVIHTDTGLRWVVRGRSELPEGERYYARLSVEDRVLSATAESCRPGSDVLVLLEKEGKGFFSGYYDLILEWKRLAASAESQQAMAAILGDNAAAVITEKHRIYVGRPSQEEAQNREILAYYHGAIDESQASRDLLLMVGASVRQEEFNPRAPRRRRLEQHPLYPAFQRLRGNSFDFDRWRTLIDEELPRYWLQYSRLEIPYEEKIPQLKNQLGALYSTLFRYTRLESRLVYRFLGKPPDKRDYVDIEHGLELDYQVSRDHMMNFVKEIRGQLRRLGL